MKNFLTRFDLSYLYALFGEATLALTFVFYITLARILGPDQYGIFSAAVALAAILALFIQFGLPTLLTREVAANPIEGSQSTVKFLVLEGLNSLVVLALLFPLAFILGYEEQGLIVCYLAVFSEVCRAFKLTLRGILQGMGWFRAESIAVSVERLATVVIALAILYQTKNLVLVVATIVIVRAVDIVGLLHYISRRVQIRSSVSPQGLVDTLKIAYPFALSGMLWVLYYQVDVVMLKSLSSGEETGFYSAAYRVLEMFSALPRVIFHVIFTRFAQYQATDPEQLPEQIYKASRLMIIIVIPAILSAGFLQTILVKSLYGEAFLAAVQSLAILLPSLSVKIYGNIADQFFQATGREKKLPLILLTAALTNVLVNFMLIPSFHSVGAAIATLVSECVLTAFSLRVLSQSGYPKAGKTLIFITLLSLLMTAIPSLILYGLKPIFGLGLILLIIAGLVLLMRRKNF